MARFGKARYAFARCGKAGSAWNGGLWFGTVWQGKDGHGRHGKFRPVKKGWGWFRRVKAGMARQGPERFVEARIGVAGQAWSQKGGNNLVYQFKIPEMFPVDAQTAGEELHRIYEDRGCLEPKDVVDESRPEEAPLHSCFEWNDETAAEKYREVQAGQIIRSVVVVREEEQQPPVEVRAFVNVQKTYRPIEVVVNSEEQMLELFNSALSELKAFERKYANLKQFSALFDEIHKLTA